MAKGPRCGAPAFFFRRRQCMLAGLRARGQDGMDTKARNDLSRVAHPDKRAVDTPSLMVDLDTLEANIARIAATCRQNGINWRPHTKGIKVPQIARKLIDAGAIGITCAKLGEAEV